MNQHRCGVSGRHLVLAIVFILVGVATTDLFLRVIRPRYHRAIVDVVGEPPELEGSRPDYGETPGTEGGRGSTSGLPPQAAGTRNLGSKASDSSSKGERPKIGSEGFSHSFQWTTPSGVCVSRDTAIGGVGSYLLHGSEYSISGALAPHPEDPRSVSPEGIGRQDEESLRMTEKLLKRRSALPEAPWEWDRFQTVGSLDTGFPAMIIGRDFSVTASPDDSVSWFEGQTGQALAEEKRAVAVGMLRGWETERRLLLGEIINHVVEVSEHQSERYDDFLAYAFIDGKFVLFRRGEAERAESVIEAGSRLYQEIEEEAKTLCP